MAVAVQRWVDRNVDRIENAVLTLRIAQGHLVGRPLTYGEMVEMAEAMVARAYRRQFDGPTPLEVHIARLAAGPEPAEADEPAAHDPWDEARAHVLPEASTLPGDDDAPERGCWTPSGRQDGDGSDALPPW